MSSLMTQGIPMPWTGPRTPVSVRVATGEDLPWIDALQKKQSHAVGFLHRAALEGHVAKGNVLIAERREDGEGRIANGGLGEPAPSVPHSPFDLRHSKSSPLGYLIASDKYLKREELGIIYQINIVPGARRLLVAATLLKAQFDRSAYGCRLYCCWCAQDLEANRFWEAMGFVPLAFRTGSRKRKGSAGGGAKGRAVDGGAPSPHHPSSPPSATGRTHIFWQKRVRAGDTTTPWWFPSQTGSGSLREDRLVLPIPPGRGWWEEMPVVLPGVTRGAGEDGGGAMAPPGDVGGDTPGPKRLAKAAKAAEGAKGGGGTKTGAINRAAALRFGRGTSPGTHTPDPPATPKARTPRRVKKNDLSHIAAARELRDRYLEEANTPGSAVALALEDAAGKHDVTRTLGASPVPGAGAGLGDMERRGGAALLSCDVIDAERKDDGEPTMQLAA